MLRSAGLTLAIGLMAPPEHVVQAVVFAGASTLITSWALRTTQIIDWSRLGRSKSG